MKNSNKHLQQAFIFAAGRGTRMMPLTNKIPKPLVRVNGRRIIDYSIEKILSLPLLNKLIINGFYLSEQIESYIAEINNKKIIFSKEEEKLETGGGLIFAKSHFDENLPLLLINGDVIWHSNEALFDDISYLMDMFLSSHCNIMMGLKKKKEYFGYKGIGDFNLNLDNNCLSKNNYDNQYCFVGYQQEINNNLESKNIKGIELPSNFFHLSTIEDIAKTEEILNKRY